MEGRAPVESVTSNSHDSELNLNTPQALSSLNML